jgi:ribonuclease BN (tRNA processing enzyme)
VLLAEPGFRVRAVTLDHGIPVLAFALEIAPALHVQEDRLVRSGLRAGPWLGELKRRLAAREGGAEILLPNGRLASAAALGEGLIGCDPARHLVYATDLADTAENRARLTAFARNADVLYCEASFREADAARARRTGHLTARACGEIAAAAGVRRLVPFHFSRRYEAESEGVYSEVRAAFPGALTYAETAVEP